MSVTKEAILFKLSSYEILNFYLQPYHNYGKKLKKGQSITNPFLLPKKQKTPSFNIYPSPTSKEWLYKDFATDHKGNCFELVMQLFKLDFPAALRKINQDFNLNIDNEPPKNNASTSQNPELIEVSHGDSSYKYRPFNQQELDFWKQYNIAYEQLQLFNVRAVESYTAISNANKKYTIRSSADKLIFAYAQNEWAKIYKPYDNKYRFQHLGTKTPGFIFGLEQLPEKGNLLFIVGGEKDCLSLNAHGYHPISPNSETATINADEINALKKRFANIIILYDNDVTGLKQSEKLSAQHNVHQITLPEMKNGKDISDFFKQGFSKEDFQSLIDKALKQVTEKSLNTEDHLTSEDYLKSTPVIPEKIYNALPFIFKEGARVFTDPRKRDVFFTAALAIISGCLPKVTGVYFQERVHPQLYTFTIAPPASGKGVLKHAKKLADKLHHYILVNSRKLKKEFEEEMEEYKAVIKKLKKNDIKPEMPVEPPFQILFVPADCSHARMVDHLFQNDGKAIICESEADTMSGVKKQEWGDYSPVLRAAFHHEKISFTRKTNNEYIEVDDTQIAVAMTGTPAQVPRLISSAEDGLFTRFLFYAFKTDLVWNDPSPKANPIVYNDHFDSLADKLMEYHKFLEQEQTNIQLNDDQWNTLNTTFKVMLDNVKIFTSEEASGIVFRLGLIVFRMCMIFSALRKCESINSIHEVFCSDEDFNSAIELGKIYLQHSLLMFNNLPKQDHNLNFKGGNDKLKFFEALPNEFTRQQAIEVGKKFKLSASTIDHNILPPLIPHHLIRVKGGTYRKVNQ